MALADYAKPYIVYHGRAAFEVRCKGPCENVLVVRRGIAQNLRIEPTPEYGELVFEMLDPATGLLGKHETAMCRLCRARLRQSADIDVLQMIYNQDVAQWITTAVTTGTSRANADMMVARFRDWKPIRVLDEPGRGAPLTR